MSLDLYLDWNSDLLVTANGSIQFANGWDHIRQRIIRNMITNSAQQLPDGHTTPPDYVFHPTFGIGMGSMVDQNPTQQFLADMQRRIIAACFADVDVDPGTVPSIKFVRITPDTYEVFITVSLINGQVGYITLNVTQ